MATSLFDSAGNRIYCQQRRIYLQLAGTTTSRCLGVLEGDTFHTRRKSGQHVMRSQDDVGFNYSLIRYGKFTHIEVALSDGRILRTTRDRVLEVGECRHFAGTGFELQIFLRLDQFEPVQESLEFTGVTP